MKTQLRFWNGGSGPVLPLTIATISAGCAGAHGGLAGPIAGAACDRPPAPIELAVPDFSGFEGRRGAITLSVLVGERGKVTEARIETGSGFPAFDHAMLLAARVARFRPATVNCDPVERWTKVTIPAEDVSGNAPPTYLNRNEMERMLVKEYPPLLRDGGIGGTVIVQVLVGERGIVQEAQVSKSSGHPALDRAALRIARVARFVPAVDDGELLSVWTTIPITFKVR